MMTEEERSSSGSLSARLLQEDQVAAAAAARAQARAQAGPDAGLRLSPLWRNYLLGQCCHALKTSMWWTGLSPLALALVGRDSAVGVVRVAFNLAVLLVSPFAGVFAERIAVERILAWTTAARGAVYVVLLPLVWLIFRSGAGSGSGSGSDSGSEDDGSEDDDSWGADAAFACMAVLSFVDGTSVAFANVVDIDMGGVDLLGQQRGVAVDDALRNKLNSIFQMVFDGSFLVFTPSLALLAWYVGVETEDPDASEEAREARKAGVLVLGFGAVFLVTTALSLYFYVFGLARKEAPGGAGAARALSYAQAGSSSTVSSLDPATGYTSVPAGVGLPLGLGGDSEDDDAPYAYEGAGRGGAGRGGAGGAGAGAGAGAGGVGGAGGLLGVRGRGEEADGILDEDEGLAPEREGVLASMWVGARLCWETRPIRWRLLFLGLEVAVEDAMVAVVITEYSHSSAYFGHGDATLTLLYTALIVAVGKLGAVFAGYLMHSHWQLPTALADFRPLFYSVLLSSASTCLLWVAHKLEQAQGGAHPASATAWASRATVFLSVTLFFLFSTAPKIGFETLLQGMASVQGSSGKIFGFVGPFISVMDSIVVMAVSAAFGLCKRHCAAHDAQCNADGFGNALAITCAVFLAHGLAEALLGPRLMLPGPDDDQLLQGIGIDVSLR